MDDEHVVQRDWSVYEAKDPQTEEEFQADEAEFEHRDTLVLRKCPRCGEPYGLVYCPVCHCRE